MTTMAYMGFGAFGADFGTTAFTYTKVKLNGYKGAYKKLDSVRDIDEKEQLFLCESKELYHSKLQDVCDLPNKPLAFWVKNVELFKHNKLSEKLFSGGKSMKLFHNFTDQELARLLELVSMSDDDFFLRFSDPSTHDTTVTIPESAPEEH